MAVGGTVGASEMSDEETETGQVDRLGAVYKKCPQSRGVRCGHFC